MKKQRFPFRGWEACSLRRQDRNQEKWLLEISPSFPRSWRGRRSGQPAGWSKCSGPTWSPDGKRIAFARVRGKANAIFLVPAGGGKTVTLYDKKPACEPHFSPDGKEIVYETETHVWAIRPDGTRHRMITYYGGLQRYPRFGPDGKSVIFCQGASTKGPWELYVVPAAGGAPRKLTDGGSDMYPHWK